MIKHGKIASWELSHRKKKPPIHSFLLYPAWFLLYLGVCMVLLPVFSESIVKWGDFAFISWPGITQKSWWSHTHTCMHTESERKESKVSTCHHSETMIQSNAITQEERKVAWCKNSGFCWFCCLGWTIVSPRPVRTRWDWRTFKPGPSTYNTSHWTTVKFWVSNRTLHLTPYQHTQLWLPEADCHFHYFQSVKTLIHLITSYQTTWGNKPWPNFFKIIDSTPNKNHFSRSVWDTKVLTKNIFLRSREHCWAGNRKGLAGSLNTTHQYSGEVPWVSQGISRSEYRPRGLFRFKVKLSCWKQDKKTNKQKPFGLERWLCS